MCTVPSAMRMRNKEREKEIISVFLETHSAYLAHALSALFFSLFTRSHSSPLTFLSASVELTVSEGGPQPPLGNVLCGGGVN